MRLLTYAEYYQMRAKQFKPEDIVAVKVVAVIGDGGTWAAYAGATTSMPDGWVAEYGDKISRAAAEALFPTIAQTYRWRD